jgi:hypothetical protein
VDVHYVRSHRLSPGKRKILSSRSNFFEEPSNPDFVLASSGVFEEAYISYRHVSLAGVPINELLGPAGVFCGMGSVSRCPRMVLDYTIYGLLYTAPGLGARHTGQAGWRPW